MSDLWDIAKEVLTKKILKKKTQKTPIFIPQVISKRTKKLKFNGRKEIKITVDINEKTKIEKISKSKSRFIEKITKLTNLLLD